MYSFDVFDTLITRKTAVPYGIFAYMQDILKNQEKYVGIPVSVRNNFFRLRIEAEKLARYTYQDEQVDDITLCQIYEAFALRGELDEEQIKKLMDLECETEYKMCVPVQKNIRRIKELLQKQEQIVLISDMYLPIEQIKGMLRKADPVLENLTLFVSNIYGKGKYTGKLYQKVKELLHISETEWIHVGDNERVDGTVAHGIGICPNLSWFPRLIPLEKELLDNSPDDSWIQKQIGCSRLARLDLGAEESKKDAVLVGSSAGGILLTSYVGWILKNCKEKKIDRLYFIARDGYVLKVIADDIICRMHLKIKTYYIYGSRRAWRMASFSERHHDIQQLLNWSHIGNIRCLSDIADVFQIQIKELRKFIPIEITDDMQEISFFTMTKIWKELQKDSTFIEFLIHYHAEKREIVKEYLKQEIDFSDDHFAFVDVSGSGYTQGCLADIIYEFYEKSIRTFFFKLDKINATDNCINFCFYPTRLVNGVIIEMFCRAPEEQTIGYQKRKKRIVPEFSENMMEKQAIIEHGFYDYLNGIKAFVNRLCMSKVDVFSQNMEQISRILKYITQRPDDVLQRFLGDMPNSVTGREKKVVLFAPVLTRTQIRKIFLEGRKEIYPNTCLEYSLLRCTRQELDEIAAYKEKTPVMLTKYFPYELCSGDIILYGAGKMGQELYRNMMLYDSIKIVQWIDKNAKEYVELEGKVENIDKLGMLSFDRIIIAVRNFKMAQDIKNELLEKAIPSDKIIWFHPYQEWKQYNVVKGEWQARDEF